MFYFPNTRKPDFSKTKSIDYDYYWQERGFILNKKLKEREKIILDLVKKGERVIDLGCGNSLLPIKLKAKGVEVSVGDISSGVIKGYSQYQITGEVINLENISNNQILGFYDVIILSEVLEHTRNPEEIISCLKNKTKKFIISIPNSAFYRYRLHLMFKGRFFTQWVYHPSEHLRFWSHIDFLDWLRALGLSAIKYRVSNGFSFLGFLPQLKNWWPNLFGHQIVYICPIGDNKK